MDKMPGLANFERLIESLVERSMIAPLRGKLQPIEIARRLERCMRDSALLSVDAQIAPNYYRVNLNPDDMANLVAAKALIEGELARHVAQSGSAQDYLFLAPPTVELIAAPRVPRRSLRVDGEIRDPGGAAQPVAVPRPSASPPPTASPPPWSAPRAGTNRSPAAAGTWALDFGSWRAALPERPVTLGRALDCDVVVPSPRVSRQHAELSPLPDGLRVHDLGSTNGTTVDGRRVLEAVVAGPGARIAFGGVEARLEAAAAGEPGVIHSE